MSFNQSRSDKSDNQYRKSGRSGSLNPQRGSSGAYAKGGGGGPAPSPGITSGSLQSSNRSSKRYNNPHGGQSRVNPPPVNLAESNGSSSGRTIPNGAHTQQSLAGASDALVTNAATKSSEPSSVEKSTRVVPKAPTPQPTPMNSDTAAPITPAKAPEDSSKPFAFQFGSFSPSFMNGISIPARTSSAPPNLDEQKRDQARHDSSRPVAVPTVPTPPKQLPPKNGGGVTDQSNAGEAHSVGKVKKEEHLSALPPGSRVQKPSVAMTGNSMAMPYHHQSQAPVQFGGPNPQIQSQGMPAASLQMPMPLPLPMGNVAQVQQQVFVSGLQHLPIHPQGIMHQGQNLSFTTQMGPQMPLGINMSQQFSQQQGGKYAGPRKTTTVKITHPETHEELRLDFDKKADSHSDGMASGARSYPNIPSQSQSVQSFAASHPLNYFPSSTYSSSSLFYPSNSVPLSSSHITPNSQQPRFSYPVNQGPQNAGFNNQLSIGSLPVNKNGTFVPGLGEAPNLEQSRDVKKVMSSGTSAVTHASTKLSGGSGIVDSTISNSSISVIKTNESPSYLGSSMNVSSTVSHKGPDNFSETSSQQSKSSSDSFVSRPVSKQPAAGSTEKPVPSPLLPCLGAVSENSVSVVFDNEGRRKESLSRSNSLKDNQKKTEKRGLAQHQVPVQSPTMVGAPSQAVESARLDCEVSDTVENKTKPFGTITSEDNSSRPGELSYTVSSDVPHANGMNIDPSVEGSVCISAEGVGALAVDSLDNHAHDKLLESSQQDKLLKMNILEVGDKNERTSEVLNHESDDIGTEFKLTEQHAAKVSQDVQQILESQDESTDCRSDCDRKADNLGVPTSNDLDSRDISLSRNDSTVSNESVSANSAASDRNFSDLPEGTSKHSKDSPENADSGSVSLSMSVNKDRSILQPNKVKTTTKGKKKMREILQKADAAGSTSDLYNAYKRPEEKKEFVAITERKESASSGSLRQLPKEAAQADVMATEKDGHDKAEPDDWEDAADNSSPKLEVVDKAQQVGDGSELTTKKYSRDFLLKFEEQCIDLPEGFEIPEDIADALMNCNTTGSHGERDPHLSPGRIMDRSGGMPRMDRRGSGHFEEDRWNKATGPFNSGRDMRMDGFGGNPGFRHGHGGNSGVLRKPVQYAGGILSGPMQSVGNQGAMQKNGPDGERWQRATNFQQRGLIPSPQTPLQIMHKAEKKYEVGKVTDEEQAKQRQLKAILNKLTPQNFEKLFEQVKAVNIDSAVTLTGVISQIFEKALMEPTFCEMYANFCSHLAAELPDFSEDNEKITFKRVLLNKCQEEFERGEREQEEANKDDEGEVRLSDEVREEKRIKARRRMLGNIRLIGELYKKKMLTERIMHECIKKLLGSGQDPDEEDIEALCKLMSTIGEMIDHPRAKEHMDAYFEMMKLLSSNMNLSSRVRFMLKDAIDLRKNKWQQKRKVEGPKKIEDVHRDAAQERQAQTSRLGRGPGNVSSSRRIPMDFSPRGPSMFSPPNTPMGMRGPSAQVRSGGSQDVRHDDRLSYEGRNLSVPLPQRPLGDDSIMLGPQGGLARGMSFRGPGAVPSAPAPDVLPGADSRRVTPGPNGYSSSSERSMYSSREDQTPRHARDRLAGPSAHEQSAVQERNINYGSRELRNADRGLERPAATLPHGGQGSALSENASSEKVWPEERLRDMSVAAIKEYYSARDVKEVALCVKDMKSPSYHPSMISLWVTDSFERKDMERDLLAKLLVSLTKSQDGILSQAQLIQGFKSVLSGLEDAVNDAPRAPEFLGQIFARVVLENIIPLKEIGQLLHEGGEEPGQLLEIGLAADVIVTTLEAIKKEKGDAVLSEIRSNSNLRLETFRPPNPIISRKLENFI